MVYGFGTIDYVVVTASVVLTIYILATNPERLLLFLPTLLTVDFFIPFVTQLTPARIIPLVLAAWMVFSSREPILKPHPNWIILFFVTLAASLLYAVLQDDAGSRPYIRALHYATLAVTFVFVARMCRSPRTLEWAIWGLAIAALVHGLYSIYQLVAVQVGLPFRGIVYSQSGVGVAYAGPAGLRINGLADEPKRLGYILFAGAIACALLASYRRGRLTRVYLLLAAPVLMLLSMLTFSSSYLAALALWTPFLMLISRWARVAGVAGVLLAALGFTAFPERGTAIADSLVAMVEARRAEVIAGLDARVVYRQEFYAEDYVKHNPESIFTGFGLGRYNRILNDEYGPGVGYYQNGGIAPINSQIYEVGFDLGVLGLIVLYVGLGALILRAGHASLEASALSAIGWLVLIQSVFINSLPILVFVCALISAYLALRRNLAEARRQGAYVHGYA